MFSVDVRVIAVTMLRNGVSRNTIFESTGVTRSTLNLWKRYYRDHGSVWRDPVLRNRHENNCAFDMTLLSAIAAFVREKPRGLLREHSTMLDMMRNHASSEFIGLRCSKSTVDFHLNKLDFTRKVVLRLFEESSEPRRMTHAAIREHIPRRCIVSVDETHTDGGDVFRRFGRALAHHRSRLLGRDPRTVPRTNTTMALSSDGGIFGFQSVVVGKGALTAADWRLFVQNLIPKLGVYVPGRPWTQQLDNCVVLLDNAPIHDAAGDTFLGNNGVPLWRLATYSPDLQPIEGVFNDLKTIIRNLVYVRPELLDQPHFLQATAASMLTRRQIIGQFDRVYVVIASILAQ